MVAKRFNGDKIGIFLMCREFFWAAGPDEGRPASSDQHDRTLLHGRRVLVKAVEAFPNIHTRGLRSSAGRSIPSHRGIAAFKYPSSPAVIDGEFKIACRACKDRPEDVIPSVPIGSKSIWQIYILRSGRILDVYGFHPYTGIAVRNG